MLEMLFIVKFPVAISYDAVAAPGVCAPPIRNPTYFTSVRLNPILMHSLILY